VHPGGVLILGADKSVVGAVGICGDTADNDEACAIAAIEAAGLSAVPGLLGESDGPQRLLGGQTRQSKCRFLLHRQPALRVSRWFVGLVPNLRKLNVRL
jgi:hypothetical protein